MLSVSESWKGKLEPYIADHSIKVIHLAEQDKETRGKYKSDFRHIVDYLACASDREECQKYIHDTRREIRHPEEYLDMMAAFSSDTRFASIKENVLKKMKKGEESVTMYSIAEELENIGEKRGMEKGIEKGIEKGLEKGLEQGSAQKSREIICNMLDDEQPLELISKYTREPLEYVYQVQREMLQYAREETAYEVEGDEPPTENCLKN